MRRQLAQQGEGFDNAQLVALKEQYGLDQPVYVQYWKWISRIIFHGDFGQSLEWQQPVADLIWQRMGVTLALTLSALIFTWLLSDPHRRLFSDASILEGRLSLHLRWASSASACRAS